MCRSRAVGEILIDEDDEGKVAFLGSVTTEKTDDVWFATVKVNDQTVN